jgi:DNA polymerase-3 subunit alpha
MEKELLGVYVSGHPLQVHAKSLALYNTHLLASAEDVPDSTTVVIGGMLTATRKATTKKGAPMMSGTFEDLTGTIEIIFFPEAYEKHWQLLKDDARLLIKGKLSNRDDEIKILASHVKPLDNLPILHLTLNQQVEGGFLVALRKLLSQFAGETPVVFHFPHLAETVVAGEAHRIEASEQLIAELQAMLGVNAVHLEAPHRVSALELPMLG